MCIRYGCGWRSRLLIREGGKNMRVHEIATGLMLWVDSPVFSHEFWHKTKLYASGIRENNRIRVSPYRVLYGVRPQWQNKVPLLRFLTRAVFSIFWHSPCCRFSWWISVRKVCSECILGRPVWWYGLTKKTRCSTACVVNDHQCTYICTRGLLQLHTCKPMSSMHSEWPLTHSVMTKLRKHDWEKEWFRWFSIGDWFGHFLFLCMVLKTMVLSHPWL
jgi:hypothetical protein